MLNRTQLLPRSFAAKTEARPELAGLLVKPGRTAATNSYILAEIKTLPAHDVKPDQFPRVPGMPDARDLPDALIIPAKTADKIAKAIPKSRNLPILENAAFAGIEDGGATFMTTDLETATPIKFRPTEGKFPDYEPIIPDTKPAATIRVNASYLLEAAKLMQKFNKLEGRAGLDEITLEVRDEETPLVIRAASPRHEALTLIMPIKH